MRFIKEHWEGIITICIAIIALILSYHANESAKSQAESAKLEHYPYLAIVSHSNNGNKQA